MFPTSLSGAACRVRLQTLMAGTPIVMNTGSLRHLLPEPRFRIFCISCQRHGSVSFAPPAGAPVSYLLRILSVFLPISFKKCFSNRAAIFFIGAAALCISIVRTPAE